MRSTFGSGAQMRLLLVDSDPSCARTIIDDLRAFVGQSGDVAHVETGCEAAKILRANHHDVLLLDLTSIVDLAPTPEEAITRLVKLASGALVIAISEGMSVSAAVSAMRAGVHDYVAKPLSGIGLTTRIEELALRHSKPRSLVLDNGPDDIAADFEGFVGRSNQMQCVFDQIERIAPSSAPVFITGESGTGKEVCAQALHQRGSRAKGAFIAINCSAIPRDLMETELFGAVRGAYTGAVDDRQGAAELADGGTLFLDEIGEMDLSLQAKLLRFLQTGTITRVGESTARQVDVRVVCATNRNPMQMIAEKCFREDLFYRLHVLPIHLPPLRQRPADILPLAHRFLKDFAREENKHFSRLSNETSELFMSRDWPGNVRQLQNLIRRIVVMFDGDEVSADMMGRADIEFHAARPEANAPAPARRGVQPMWKQEQRIVEEALEHFGGNIAQAAAALEISPSTIYRKRQAWDEMERAGLAANAA